MTREEFLKLLPELAKNYKPAPEVVEHIGGLNLLMVIGPSGVGKTTLINRLPYKYVISDNTRGPREEEKEGVDYFFRQDYEQIVQEIKNGHFVQVAVDSGGDLKATRDKVYPEEGTAVMAVVADVIPIVRKLDFRKTISIFVTPPSYEVWTKRLQVHKLQPEQLKKRLAEAERSFKFALSDEQTHFVLNDELSKTVQQTEGIVNGKIDQAREAKARQAAQSILDAIK